MLSNDITVIICRHTAALAGEVAMKGTLFVYAGRAIRTFASF